MTEHSIVRFNRHFPRCQHFANADLRRVRMAAPSFMLAYLSWHGLCLGFSHGRCLMDQLASRSRSSSRLICVYPCFSSESSFTSDAGSPLRSDSMRHFGDGLGVSWI